MRPKTYLAALFLFLAALNMPGSVKADNPVEIVLKGCSQELKTFCPKVTPGEGRLLSCIDAHEDQITGQCVYALNRASFLLQSLELAIDYVGVACLQDAVTYCPSVELGDGRVLKCLASNRQSLSGPCKTALSDIVDID